MSGKLTGSGDTPPTPMTQQQSPFARRSSFQLDLQSNGTTPRESLVGTEGDSSVKRVSGQQKWADAGGRVMQAQKVTSSFKTLRDQKEVNEIHPSDLKLHKKLGEGGFATVNLCSYNDRLVAVKCLKPAKMPLEDYESFIREAALIRKLKHKYIIDYVGIGYYNNSSDEAKLNSMFIVQEYMDKGTLKSLVSKQMQSPNRKVYSNRQALEWLLQLAKALAYLHSAIPMVIHRDLKLENVLLTTEQNTLPSPIAKLGDFGLSAFVRREYQNKRRSSAKQVNQPTMSQIKDQEQLRKSARATMEKMGTLQRQGILDTIVDRLADASRPPRQPKTTSTDLIHKVHSSEISVKAMPELSGQTGSYMYMSPEMFLNKDYNEKVDVFSFGSIAYELLHRYLMFFSVAVVGTMEEVEGYARNVSQGYRPPIGAHWPAEIKDLLSQCWDQDPAKRPAMSEVEQRIQKMLDDNVLDTMKPANTGCCSVQ